jgi:hypothetical protein
MVMAMATMAAWARRPAEIKILDNETRENKTREIEPREIIEEISNMTRLPTPMAQEP